MTPNSYQRNRDAKAKKTQATCTNESITLPPAETLFQNGQNSAPLTTGTDKLQVQKNEGNFTAMINLFHNNIKGGPAYICICCDIVQSNWGQTLNKLQQKVFQRIMAHSDVLNNISKVPKNRSSGRPRKTEKKIPIQSLYEKPQGTQFI